MLHKQKPDQTPWWQRGAHLVSRRFGLAILLLLLTVISWGAIKPDFYLLGWDNFSSYLNPRNNLFNTLFATWREHRGLGVPSDAEVNDLFRQVFDWLVSLILGKRLADQVYMVSTLWGGVLGMYALGRKISQQLKQSYLGQELFGFLAAIFYLFNLSTLAAYYFPMIMYNSRFLMLPTMIYVLLDFLENKPLSLKRYLAYVAILLVGFGSFMVPTIFIVLLIMLGWLFLVFRKSKRLVQVLAFYILLSLYWLLPFVNYTIQKSAIVPEAPTFIEINEAMLNKPKAYYSFERQAKLRPNFFDSQFFNNQTDQYQDFHELANQSESGWQRWALWLFPGLYLGGISYALLVKRERVLVWLSLTTATFLLLSMKEYSPVGFLYSFVADRVPFANTIFRFGDTKFHVMIAFAGALLAACLLAEIAKYLIRVAPTRLAALGVGVVVGGLVVTHAFTFKSYFTGNLIGFFLYNQVPSAYFEMAEVINRDPEPVRVVHLPLDEHSYWKPYTWGYFGSSFLHFLLNKPLFDRSFEPASFENAAAHREIIELTHLADSVTDETLLEERALDLLYLLQSLSVKYVIDDQTISTNIDARNVAYWGTISPKDSHRLMSFLEKEGHLKLVREYAVVPLDYSQDYSQLYPYNHEQSKDAYPPRQIYLYELVETEPRLELIAEADKVHSMQNQPLPARLTRSLGHSYIQADSFDDQALVYPFTLTSGSAQIGNHQIQLDFPGELSAGTYLFEGQIDPGLIQAHLITIAAEKSGQTLLVYLEEQLFPQIEGTAFSTQKPPTKLELDLGEETPAYLQVSRQVFSLAHLPEAEKQRVGSVITHGPTATVKLLYPSNNYDVSSALIQREEDPQCLRDALDKPESHITGDEGILRIGGQNVSNCLTTEVLLAPSDMVVPYAVLELKTKGTVTSLTGEKTLVYGKPSLREDIAQLDNPLVGEVCVRPEGEVECLNKEQLIRIEPDERAYSLPVRGDMSGKALISFRVHSGQQQRYETTTQDIILKTYREGDTAEYVIEESAGYVMPLGLVNNRKLQLMIPMSQSEFSEWIDFENQVMLFAADQECYTQSTDQALKVGQEGILSYAFGCRNFIRQTIPFSSNNFYWWHVAYQHVAGAMPALIALDKHETYYFSKLLPNQVAPNDYFSLPFQGPEAIFTKKAIADMMQRSPLYSVSGMIAPQPDLQDGKNKDLVIQHHSPNEGLIKLNQMALLELPNFWPESRLRPTGYEPVRFSASGQVVSFEKLLPSVWQVTTETQAGEFLLKFNEQFDRQWLVFDVPTLGHLRCDGRTNCYQVILPDGRTTFHLVYVPEALFVLGSTLTLATIVIGLHWFVATNERST